MMSVDRDQLDRLTAGAPTPERTVELLVDAFAGCDPDVLAAVPVTTEETSAA